MQKLCLVRRFCVHSQEDEVGTFALLSIGGLVYGGILTLPWVLRPQDGGSAAV